MLLQILYPILSYNLFFYLFVFELILNVIIAVLYIKSIHSKINETQKIEKKHKDEVNEIKKGHLESMEKIKNEMLKREEDKSRQLMESEKETLHVLSGVSNLLELDDKVNKFESNEILKNLNEIQNKVDEIRKKLEK